MNDKTSRAKPKLVRKEAIKIAAGEQREIPTDWPGGEGKINVIIAGGPISIGYRLYDDGEMDIFIMGGE